MEQRTFLFYELTCSSTYFTEN